MASSRKIFEFLNKLAPVESAMDFDNCGLLVGGSAQVNKAVLVLDITREAVQFAADIGAQLLISHHPVIFNPLKKLAEDSPVYMLAAKGIDAISMHTNLDRAAGVGVNVCLAKACGLKDITLDAENCIAYGSIEPQSTEEFAKNVKVSLDCAGVRFADNKENLTKIAVSSGAGGCNIFTIASKADALVTGEIKHHELIFAAENGISVIDASHRKTEEIVLPTLKEALKTEFQDVEFEIFSGKNDNLNFCV